MKLISKILGLLVTLTLLAPALAKSDKLCDKNCKEEIVKYVQGGACASGNGTKKSPFATLLEAQDSSWDVLIVLASPVALDFGITLKPGQKLIGECNPTKGILPTQATITNSNGDAPNNGNGVVVMGDATIENIYFKNTYSSAINYDKARSLTVKNVLIDGANQNAGIAAIQGTCPKSGDTHIERAIIRNGNGQGVLDAPSGSGINREIVVCTCQFDSLNDVGITLQPTGANSSCAVIKDAYFHDFQISSQVIQCLPTSGAESAVLIQNSNFYNNFSLNGNGTGVLANPSGTSSSLKLKIDSCSFIEIEPLSESETVQIDNQGESSEVIVVNSVSVNFSTFFQSTGGASLHNTLCNNTVTGVEFYSVNNSFSGSTEITEIQGNILNGALFLLDVTSNPAAPWKQLAITLEDNCFTGNGDSGSIGIATYGSGGSTVTITAHNNSIIDYNMDINNGTAATINATSNWWGPGKACATSTDCNPLYQTCQHSVCVGPANVINGDGGTVLTIPSLTAPIRCPQSCPPVKCTR